MNELSKNQLHYLNMHRRHKRIIVVSRVSILLTFLFLWEFSANTWTDRLFHFQQSFPDCPVFSGNDRVTAVFSVISE